MSIAQTQSTQGRIMPTDNTQDALFAQDIFFGFNHTKALELGFVESFILGFISHRIAWHEKKGSKKIRGKTWARVAQHEILKTYPYFTEHAIRKAFDNLIEKRVLERDYLNYNPYDRTSWYTILIKRPSIPQNIGMAPPTNEEIFEKNAGEIIPISTPCTNHNSTIFESAECIELLNINTYKAAAEEKPQSLEPSGEEYRSAAAASLVKKTKLETKVYPSLEPLDVPLSEKQYLVKRYSQALVDEAVAWVTSPGLVIKKSTIAALKWFCTLPPAERPKPQENPVDLIEKNQTIAKRGEQLFQSPYASFDVCRESLIFSSPQGYTLSEIRYDNKNFVAELQQEMLKRGFERIG
jgi:hypothetical protein